MSLPALEQSREQAAKVSIDLLERGAQALTAFAVEIADRTAQTVHCLRQFLDLGGALLALAIEFDEFVGGDEIDGAEAFAVGDQPVVLRRFGGCVADARAVEPGLLREQRRRAFKTLA